MYLVARRGATQCGPDRPKYSFLRNDSITILVQIIRVIGSNGSILRRSLRNFVGTDHISGRLFSLMALLRFRANLIRQSDDMMRERERETFHLQIIYYFNGRICGQPTLTSIAFVAFVPIPNFIWVYFNVLVCSCLYLRT